MGTFLNMLCFYYKLGKSGNKYVYSTLCNSAVSLCILTTVYKLDHSLILYSYGGLLTVLERTEVKLQLKIICSSDNICAFYNLLWFVSPESQLWCMV